MKLFHLILFASLHFGLSGCSKKNGEDIPYPTDSIGRIDRWIADSLRRYYYWSDAIPGKPDYTKSPDNFFTSLLSSSDRFSWVSNGLDIAPPSNSYFLYGFHYALVQASGYDGLIGVVTDINKGGAADGAGFKRGSYFMAVNGEKVTTQNMEAVNLLLRTPSSVRITRAAYTDSGWKPAAETALYEGYAYEDPVRYTRTFTAGGIATGYLYYTSFDENYDDRLLQAFDEFRQAGVKELILDLRYNAGGSVASSAKLAALIANRLSASETFAIYAGNRFEGKRGRLLQEVVNTSGNAAGRTYDELKKHQLSLSRVFILTTGATVSAAELIVNNLKPFLQVVQIGETTRGKNEAGFVIQDTRNPPQVEWKMEPTVYKLFNKNGEGNYEKGLIPQYLTAEMALLPLADIGTSDDPLVNKALSLIYGRGIPPDFTTLRSKQTSIKIIPVYRSAEEGVQFSLMHIKKS